MPVDLAMSIAVYDDELQQSVEPGTPSTTARLATVTAAREHGLPVTVFLMPILPYLTDTRAHLDAALERVAASGASAVMHTALHLRPGTKEWFMQWLEARASRTGSPLRSDVQVQRVRAQGIPQVAGRQVPSAGTKARPRARAGRPGHRHRAVARASSRGRAVDAEPTPVLTARSTVSAPVRATHPEDGVPDPSMQCDTAVAS